ncbi:MAG: IBR domain-containing protein [Endozoicomonadaceae bacterium]|nr:IBR domain-containing protein [Endozoicomonadaceae bacterium]
MNDNIEKRNARLTACYIPNSKSIINYLNAVRKHQGKQNDEICAAEKDLPQSARERLNSNYKQVMAGNAVAAFEKAIVIHEVLMFEGADAILSYHPTLNHTAQSSRPERCTASKNLLLNRSPSLGIDGVQFLEMIRNNDDKTAYTILEKLCNDLLIKPADYNEITYLTEQFNLPEYDISYFVEGVLKYGRKGDYSGHYYKRYFPTVEALLKKRQPIEIPKESSKNEWADIFLLPRYDLCDICRKYTSVFATSCCSAYLCLDCVSKNIETQGRVVFESWQKRGQMVECLRCTATLKLGAYEQALSEKAQRILSYFHQRYIANFYSTYSNGIPVFCDNGQCTKAYTLNNDQSYFQCDNIEHHVDQRVKLYHSVCGTLWTHEHNCPQSKKNITNNKINNIEYMIYHIDTVRPCIGVKNNSCTVLIEKIDGCNNVKCTKCDTTFCWICEKTWSFNHHRCNVHSEELEYRTHENREKRLDSLNILLAILQ